MRARLRLVAAVAVCALVLGACDWPMFRSGPAGTGFNGEGVITTANVSTLTPLWSVPVTVATSGTNQLVEGQGTLMLGNQAYDASSGQSRWTSSLLDGGAATIGNNLVYGTGPGSGPDTLRALDITNGVQRWSQVIDFAIQPPVLAGNTIYVGESAPHGQGQGIATFDAKTGTPGWGLSFLTIGPFTVANGLLYVQGERTLPSGSQIGLFAFDATTGAPRWVVPTSPCGQSNTLPVVANGKVYSDGQTFDASNGAFLWNWPVCPTGTAANDFPSRTTDISVSSDTVFVPYLNVKFGMLLGAFDAQTGRTRWTIGWSPVGPTSSTPEPAAPAVTDDVVFGVASNGFGDTAIIGDSAKTGARLWDSPFSPSKNYIDPIVANGVVYDASTDGHLDAFHLPGR